MGWAAIISVFAAAILGGLSSFSGTILGAYVVAFSENTLMLFLNFNFGLDLAYKPAIPFIIIIAVALAASARFHRDLQARRRLATMINIDIGATAVAVLTLFGIYSLMAISLNLEYGVAGVPNFGKALFVSIGAYTAGITYTRVLPLLAGGNAIHPCGPTMGEALQLRSEIMASQPIAGFVNLGLTFVIAAIVAAAVGFAASYVTLRLKEEWFLALGSAGRRRDRAHPRARRR